MRDEDIYTKGLPDDCILNSGMRVVSYLDKDGEMAFNISHYGDMPFTHFIGLIEVAKLHFWERAKEEWGQ